MTARAAADKTAIPMVLPEAPLPSTELQNFIIHKNQNEFGKMYRVKDKITYAGSIKNK